MEVRRQTDGISAVLGVAGDHQIGDEQHRVQQIANSLVGILHVDHIGQFLEVGANDGLHRHPLAVHVEGGVLADDALLVALLQLGHIAEGRLQVEQPRAGGDVVRLEDGRQTGVH